MTVIDLEKPEAVFELIEFNPVKYVRPFNEEPKPVPTIAQPLPVSAKNKFFEKLIPADIVDRIVNTASYGYAQLDDRHQDALKLALNFHLGRRARQGAFAIACMGASDLNDFNDYFQSLTRVEYHMPFIPHKKQKISRKILGEIYPPLYSVLSMEAGAVAVGAYFTFCKPEYRDQVAETVADRLEHALKQKNTNKPLAVHSKLKPTRRVLGEILDEENKALEPYRLFAAALQEKLCWRKDLTE